MSASITLEASVIVPLYVFVFAVFCYFLVILNFQVKVDKALYNAARTMAKCTYTYDAGEAVDTVAATALVISEVGSKNIQNMGIIGGVAGFHFLFSDFGDEIVDLVVQYNIKLPFPVIGTHYLSFMQRARTRSFIGVMPDDSSQNGNYVYITETGSVFHKTLECTYLKLSIREVLTTDAKQMRNREEEAYSLCEICGDLSYEPPYTYITDYGNRYHYSCNCSGLKRGIMKINVKDVGMYRPCSRCGG